MIFETITARNYDELKYKLTQYAAQLIGSNDQHKVEEINFKNKQRTWVAHITRTGRTQNGYPQST